MKKKFLIGATAILIVITTLLSLITTSKGANNWYVEQDEVQGVSWYYEVVSGEAVNVRTTGSANAKRIRRLEVPETLGGYTVTRIQGEVGWMGSSIRNIAGLGSDSLLEEVVLPEGLKTIGHDSFRECRNLKKINIPSTLEKIESLSFEGVVLDNLVINNPNLQLEDYLSITVKNLEVKDIETCNLNSRFGGIKVTESINVDGVKNLIKCATGCSPNTVVTISSDIEKISKYAITGPTDGYVDKYEEEVTLVDYTLNGNTGINYHFKNIEKVKTNLPEGIKAIDVEKNEEFTEAKVGTGSNFTFKLEQEEGYNYEDYTVYLEDVKNYDLIEGAKGSIQKINARFGEEYTIENVRQYKKIHVQLRKDTLDLNLKQYVWGINNEQMNNSREPVAKIQEDRSIEYKTNKNALYVKYGDKVKYGIRVYNEGTIDGTANKITIQIPEGLTFNEESGKNDEYGWVKSADGRTATTEYLRDKTIESYSIYDKVEYEEIFIYLDVEVLEETVDRELVTTAQITETSGTEQDTEDNTDTEAVTTSRNTTQPFELIVNKIDGLDNALLNGATFDLLDENKNVIKSGVTADGGKINFGTVYAYGYQKTRYYIRETYTPEGYKNHLKYLIRLDVVPTYSDISANNRVDFEIDIQFIDIETSKYETIEISTKEQLMAIESNKEEKYVLTQDIDLEGVTWIPSNVENVKLDGQGHKITNLKIEGNSDTNRKVGLFATYSGIIENLTLEDVDIDIKLYVDPNAEDRKTFIKNAFEPEETEEEIHAVGGIIGYSKGVILKNCKVTGEVKSETNNVGGLVGHSKEGTITVFRNCINEANVTACYDYEHEYTYTYNYAQNEEKTTVTDTTKERLGNNAGGMIGTVLGPVYVTGCENKGEILAGLYNAGGMVGTAECKKYDIQNVFGQCGDKLNIYVKNEKITGKYKITINKIDSEEKNLLQGAKFTVYDSEKRPIEGYENVELENGTLIIPETIERTGIDTFYIKETQAPEGYVPLTDTYIKVEVEKTWDSEEQKYETETTCTALTEREMEQDVANTSEEVVNEKIDDTENRNVKLKTDDVTIDQGSINKGSVYSGGINAGGLVGHSTCSVEVTDSKNEGNVTSDYGYTAGVVGQIILPVDREGLLYVNNVENTGDITQEDSKYENLKERESEHYYFMVNNPETVRPKINTYGTGAVAGISAVVNSNVEIYNSKNVGNLSTEGAGMAGIIGISYSDLLTIDNCENTGNFELDDKGSQTGSSPGNGGILGTSFPYDIDPNDAWNNIPRANSIHKITNCKNKGTFVISSHTGGIVGHGSSKTLEISNCTVSDTSIEADSGNYGGIMGNSENEVLNIHDNNISKFKVLKEGAINYASTGGVLGESCANGNVNVDYQVVKINNCNVEELDTTTVRSNGGIVGATTGTKAIEINGCNVKGQLRLVGNNGTHGDVAGILASVSGSGSNLKVTSCNVDKCYIYNHSSSGDTGVSGCLGSIGVPNYSLNSIECKKVKVTNSKILQLSGGLNNTKNAAGILAYAAANYVNIEDSDLDNVELEQHSGNVGGIVSVVHYGQNLTIDGCDSNELKINNNVSGVSSSSYASCAGILLMAEVPTTVVKNCNVINATMEGTSQLSGGIAWAGGNAWTQNNTTISNVNLEGSTITSNADYNNSSMYTFNTAGLITTGMGTITMSDCLVKDCNISSPTINTAAMVSNNYGGSLTMTNCEVNHTKVENKFNKSGYTTCAVGGMVATAGTVTMTNCKITNGSEVISKCSNTGGLVGISLGSGRFTKCNADNLIIKTDRMTGSKQDVGGIAGTIEGGTYLNECSVTGNTTITSVATSAGGIVGTAKSLYQCKDCKVENIAIDNGAAANYSQYTGVAGMIGTYYNNCDLENATVRNVSLTSSSDSISGVVGYGYFNKIKDSDIEDITVNHTNKVGHSNSTGRGVAGISVFPNTATEIQSTTIKNIKMNIASGSISFIGAGGLFGYTYNGIKIDEDSEISNINITNNTNGSTAGIVATYSTSSKLEIPKLEGFNNIVVKGKQNAGAILAYTYGGVDIDKLTGSNITVVGENYVGGLFGMEASPSSDWTIENVDLSNVYVSGKGNVGGIIGGAMTPRTGTTKTILNNINIANEIIDNTGIDLVTPKVSFTLSGKTYNHTGGVIGNTTKAELNNIHLANFEVKLNEEEETSTATGSVGAVVGNAEEDLVLNGITLDKTATSVQTVNILPSSLITTGEELLTGKLVEETDEEINVELKPGGDNYFVLGEDGNYVPNNLGAADESTALSYFELDLTEKQGYYEIIVDAEGSTVSPFWGNVSEDEPLYSSNVDNDKNVFFTMRAQNPLSSKQASRLEGGKKYYISFGYISKSEDDIAKIKGIELKKVSGRLTPSANKFFIEKDGVYVPNNKGLIQGYTAMSSMEIDLTNETDDYSLTVNAEAKVKAPFWAVVTENEPADKESYGQIDGRLFFMLDGTFEAKDYSASLKAGKKYYLTIAYIGTSLNDDVKINSISLKKLNGVLKSNEYNYFMKNGEKYMPSNLMSCNRYTINASTTALSYIEIDLTEQMGNAKLNIKGRGKSNAPFWGILTENEPASGTSYNQTNGRLFYIQGSSDIITINVKETLLGGTKYYVTFGYINSSTTDIAEIDSVEVEATRNVDNNESGLAITENKVVGNGNYVGALLGYGKVTTENINIDDVYVDSKNCNAMGTIGFIVTGSDVKNINLKNSTITSKSGYIGGIAGMANDNITSCTVTDSEIKLTGKNGATGGILGHGSNTTGTDVTIEGCKVIDSKVTGNSQVGGISGGAVIGIIDCYVGGKENETFEAGTYAVEIKGKSAVGGIIGDAGVFSNDNQQMLTMTGTNIYNSLIEGKENVDELVGIHGRFSESYTTGTQTENITTSNATNCRVNIVTE